MKNIPLRRDPEMQSLVRRRFLVWQAFHKIFRYRTWRYITPQLKQGYNVSNVTRDNRNQPRINNISLNSRICSLDAIDFPQSSKQGMPHYNLPKFGTYKLRIPARAKQLPTGAIVYPPSSLLPSLLLRASCRSKDTTFRKIILFGSSRSFNPIFFSGFRFFGSSKPAIVLPVGSGTLTRAPPIQLNKSM